MNETTAIESIRVAASLGSAFAVRIGQYWASKCEVIEKPEYLPEADRKALIFAFGEISPAMIAAYRGAFEGAV
jgi:hypothetical protein